MVLENRRKSLIQHGERSEQRLHFESTKVKNSHESYLKTWNSVRSLLIGQKLLKIAKIKKFKCDIFSNNVQNNMKILGLFQGFPNGNGQES